VRELREVAHADRRLLRVLPALLGRLDGHAGGALVPALMGATGARDGRPGGAGALGAGEREPLSEHLLAVYQDHYARDGRAAEHLCIELDERDLDDWIDMARAQEAELVRLRGREVAARGVIEAARLLDECWHWAEGDDAEHRALCAALDRYWLAG
jgi:hypothetical protein